MPSLAQSGFTEKPRDGEESLLRLIIPSIAKNAPSG